MFNDYQSHRILLLGIAASLSFTVFVSGILFGQIEEVSNDVDTLLADVGYIRGVVDSWNKTNYP